MGTCKDCVDDADGTRTYMNETNHHEQQCRKWDLKCGKGERVSVSQYDPKKAPVCLLCPSKTYQDKDDHQEDTCVDQKECAPGEKISPYTNMKKQSCLACDPHTYRDDDKHRKEECVTQPLCRQSETYVLSAADNFTAKAKCLDCNAAIKTPDHPLHVATDPMRTLDKYPDQMTHVSNHRIVGACVDVVQQSSQGGDDAGLDGGGIAAIVIVLLVLLAAGTYYWHRTRTSDSTDFDGGLESASGKPSTTAANSQWSWSADGTAPHTASPAPHTAGITSTKHAPMETSFTAGVYDELGAIDLSAGTQADYAEVDEVQATGIRTEPAYVEPGATMLMSPDISLDANRPAAPPRRDSADVSRATVNGQDSTQASTRPAAGHEGYNSSTAAHVDNQPPVSNGLYEDVGTDQNIATSAKAPVPQGAHYDVLEIPNASAASQYDHAQTALQAHAMYAAGCAYTSGNGRKCKKDAAGAGILFCKNHTCTTPDCQEQKSSGAQHCEVGSLPLCYAIVPSYYVDMQSNLL